MAKKKAVKKGKRPMLTMKGDHAKMPKGMGSMKGDMKAMKKGM